MNVPPCINCGCYATLEFLVYDWNANRRNVVTSVAVDCTWNCFASLLAPMVAFTVMLVMGILLVVVGLIGLIKTI
jgi:hypothetical protein